MNCPSCDKSDRGGKTCFPEKIVERPILFRLVKIASSIGDEEAYPPTVGLYRNVLLNYEVNNHSYMYSSDGIPVFLETSIPQSIYDDLNNLQQEIDDLKNSPDVVDIVATYAGLQAYDTQHLGDNDIVRVLQDETHGGDSTYYRWDKTNSAWVYIGASPAACTIVYRNNAEPGTTNQHLYKDPAFATAISAGELEEAAGKGLVILMSIDQNDTSNYWTFTLVSIYKDNSGYQFEFLERDAKWEYEATASTDTVFTRNVTYMLNSSTRFWGQTVNNSEVKGNLTFSGNLATTGVGFIPGTNNLEIVGGTASILLSGTTANNHEVDFNTAQLKGLKDGTANTDAVTVQQLKAAGIRTLTSADYNYPANNPDKVCLGLLQPGYYIVKAGTKFYPTATNFSSTRENDFLVEVSTVSATYKDVIYTDTTGYLILYRVNNNGVDNTSSMTQNPGLYSILTGKTVIDNLTSTYTASPLSANQGKVLNDKIEGRVKTNAGAPTTSTVGTVGQLLEDTTNGDLYICTDATNPYVWEEVGTGGGPTVAQTTGTSTTDVMSQASTSQMVFPSGFETSKDRIAVGDNAVVSAAKGVAIGQRATSSHAGSVAIGHGAITHTVGEVSINSAYNTSYGYNNTSYRLLTGLYDPQSAHDAATKGYVDNAVINGGTTAPTSSTVGVVGTLYSCVNSGTPEVYMCTAVSGSTYTWAKII